MSVVKINAIKVPPGAGAELEARFGARAGTVAQAPGFEAFELLRPANGDTYFVYTRWESEAAFLNWRNGEAFARAHAEGATPAHAEGAAPAHAEGAAPAHAEGAAQPPVSTDSELLEFEVIQQEVAQHTRSQAESEATSE